MENNEKIFEVPNGMNKICPLLLNKGTKPESCICLKHLCAWYSLEIGDCVIHSLIYPLSEIVDYFCEYDEPNNIEENAT